MNSLNFEAYKKASQLYNIFSEVPERYEFNKELIEYYDKEMNDITHLIELTSFNAAAGYQYARKLQENRRKRRVCKDENMLLKPVYDFVKKHQDLINDLRTIQSETDKLRQLQANRQYYPRTATSMREAFEKAMGKVNDR